jgi:hypothetical protein
VEVHVYKVLFSPREACGCYKWNLPTGGHTALRAVQSSLAYWKLRLNDMVDALVVVRPSPAEASQKPSHDFSFLESGSPHGSRPWTVIGK